MYYKRKTLFIPSHDAFGVDYNVLFQGQGFLVSYELNTVLAKTSTVVTYLAKSSIGKNRVDVGAEQRPRHPPAEIAASPQSSQLTPEEKKNLSAFKYKIRGY